MMSEPMGDFAVGDTVEFNKDATWRVVRALTDRHGQPVLCLDNKHQYLAHVPARRCTLVRRKDEAEPSAPLHTVVKAMNGWRVGDVVLYQGEEHRIVGMHVDGNASLHIVVANQYRQSEVLGELTLLRRAGDDKAGGEGEPHVE